MSDTCPKCGAFWNTLYTDFIYWNCGTRQTVGQPLEEGIKCLRNQLASANAEKLILLGELNRLIGYVATCKADNTVDWMIGLELRINSAVQAVGDNDRVRLIRAGNDWLFINRKAEEPHE